MSYFESNKLDWAVLEACSNHNALYIYYGLLWWSDLMSSNILNCAVYLYYYDNEQTPKLIKGLFRKFSIYECKKSCKA